MKLIPYMVCIISLLTQSNAQDNPSDKAPLPFTSIPYEIGQMILEHSDHMDLLSLKLVCRETFRWATDPGILSRIQPVSFSPKQGELVIPTGYTMIQILGSTEPKTILNWGIYPHVTCLSIATNMWPIKLTQIDELQHHFPNLKELVIQSNRQIRDQIPFDIGSLKLTICGFDFDNSIPFPISRLTAKLFGACLAERLPRLEKVSGDVLCQTALVLDQAATKIWRQIGITKTYDQQEHLKYYLDMLVAPIGSRKNDVMMARVEIVSLLGINLEDFLTRGIFPKLKTMLKVLKNQPQILSRLIKLVRDIRPESRVSFICCLGSLSTTGDRIGYFVKLMQVEGISPAQLTDIIQRLVFLTQLNKDHLNHKIRREISQRLTQYVLSLESVRENWTK